MFPVEKKSNSALPKERKAPDADTLPSVIELNEIGKDVEHIVESKKGHGYILFKREVISWADIWRDAIDRPSYFFDGFDFYQQFENVAALEKHFEENFTSLNNYLFCHNQSIYSHIIGIFANSVNIDNEYFNLYVSDTKTCNILSTTPVKQQNDIVCQYTNLTFRSNKDGEKIVTFPGIVKTHFIADEKGIKFLKVSASNSKIIELIKTTHSFTFEQWEQLVKEAEEEEKEAAVKKIFENVWTTLYQEKYSFGLDIYKQNIDTTIQDCFKNNRLKKIAKEISFEELNNFTAYLKNCVSTQSNNGESLQNIAFIKKTVSLLETFVQDKEAVKTLIQYCEKYRGHLSANSIPEENFNIRDDVKKTESESTAKITENNQTDPENNFPVKDDTIVVSKPSPDLRTQKIEIIDDWLKKLKNENKTYDQRLVEFNEAFNARNTRKTIEAHRDNLLWRFIHAVQKVFSKQHEPIHTTSKTSESNNNRGPNSSDIPVGSDQATNIQQPNAAEKIYSTKKPHFWNSEGKGITCAIEKTIKEAAKTPVYAPSA